MNKKHGFTLIELLAVIVVLAILVLILIPIVTTTIKNTKKGSAEVSAQHYVKAVELAVSNSELNKNHIPDGTYTIDSEGNLTGSNLPNGKLEIEATGTKPNGGTIVIKNGQVTTESTMTVGDYDVKYDSTSKEYVATEKGGSSSTTVVYRWSDDTINIGDTIEPSKYTADASMLNKKYYLKHVLDKDNKVTESYACARYDNEEYCVQGGDASYYGYAENETDYTGNMLILKQLENKGLSCGFPTSFSTCLVDTSLLCTIYAYPDGRVMISQANYNCYVNGDGSSSCVSS